MSDAPPPVDLAVKLMFAGAALAFIGIVRLPLQTDQLREKLQDRNTSGVNIDTLVTTSIATGILFGLIGVGLWIWMALMNAKGRNWARITATVLGAVNLFLTPIGLVAGAAFGSTLTPLSVVLSVVTLGLVVAILFLLWQPASSAWFTSRSAPQGSYPPYPPYG